MIFSVLITLVGIFVAYLLIVVVHYKLKSDRYGCLLRKIAEDKKTVLSEEVADDLKDQTT